MSNNPHPHGFIPSLPPVTQQPAVRRGPLSPPRSPQLSPLRRQPAQMTIPTIPPRPRIQSAPDHYPTTTTTTSISFPEPQFYRTTTTPHRESLSPPSNRSIHGLSNNTYNSNDMGFSYSSPSVVSFASSYAEDDHYGLGSPEVSSPISCR